MNRRTAIKQLFILAGGIAIATSCNPSSNSSSIALRDVPFTAAEEEFLGSCVEAIIPQSDSPGARELNLHLFVMKMVDDCQSPEEQKEFLAGLQAAISATDSSPAALQAYLGKLPAEDVFFKILKRRTIQGYLNSEYVMKNKLVYELVPGRYNGALKIEA